MPLHLLGKKSWNVYNKDNIERVRRDEARAKAEEEENERKQREEDAERRIDILRGKIPVPLNDVVDEKERHPRSREKLPVESRHRKRRRLAGENDTDRDIRFAKEDAELARQRVESKASRRRTDDAPIVDKSGHISLFPEESTSRTRRSDKNPEAEAETAKKNQEFENQYMMRLSNAAGYKQQLTSTPWYSSNTEISTQNAGLPNKNVWGDEDPRRQEREKIRIATNDPLAAMKKGVKQLKEVERERTKWAEERERELKALKREEKDKEKRRRRRHQGNVDSDDSLDGFRLDAGAERRKRRHHRSRSRDRDRDRGSGRDRSRHDEAHRKRRNDRHESKTGPKPEKVSVAWSQAPGKRYSAQFAGT
ncbi:hypothetical protein A7D00_0667 [Trichophyton violaceum]|uniref:CBF1-interacting co-repressor CIR N-terminal domain-containing protein n=1 Tax=Trichophyton violaceum TaxID=34388 RepID=A0A178FSB0_TRIVO|nr:hypothetical protein A7D00_0667 [Trichophyton violaceum]